MMNTWTVIFTGMAASLFGLAVDGFFAVTGLEYQEPFMAVEKLEYRDGKFWQTHRISAEVVHAQWAASIWEEQAGQRVADGLVCGGGGSGTYKPDATGHRSSGFPPSMWTGGDCSGLVRGKTYIGTASWSYTNQEGGPETIYAEVIFTYEG